MARLDSVLSFSQDPDANQPTNDEADSAAYDDGAGSDDEDGFEFAFAPPLTAADADAGLLAPADDLFAGGRLLPAYPVFDRRRSPDDLTPSASTAPPSPDNFCAWAPRSAPGSPARDGHHRQQFPKSASTGEARRFWRLRDLVGGRSHSDGKEKFVFLQPGNSPSASASASAAPSKMLAKAGEANNKKPSPKQQQSKKKGKAGGVTEMDMATAHRLFYGKQQQGGAFPGDNRKQQHSSYLPYRTGIVGFFATAHALGRSHHPY